MVADKKDKYKKISIEEFNDSLKLLIDSGDKKLSELSKEEWDRLFEEQYGQYIEKYSENKDSMFEDEFGFAIDPPEPSVNPKEILMKKNPYYWDLDFVLKQSEIDSVNKIFSSFTKDYEKSINELTGLDIKCGEPKLNSIMSVNDCCCHVEYNYEFDYEKILKINNRQIHFAVTPKTASYILLDSIGLTKPSKLKREIINEFLYKPLIDLIVKNSKSPDFNNLIECDEQEKWEQSADGYIYIEIPLSLNDLQGKIIVALSESLLKLFVTGNDDNENKEQEEKLLIEELQSYKDKNAYAIFADCNISEYEMQDLYVGKEFLIEQFDTSKEIFGPSNVSYIVNNKKVAKCQTLLLERKYAIEISQIYKDEEETDKKSSFSNFYIILGTKTVSEGHCDNLKKSLIVELDSDCIQDFPIVYNNKIVAMAKTCSEINLALIKITKVFESPIDFIGDYCKES